MRIATIVPAIVVDTTTFAAMEFVSRKPKTVFLVLRIVWGVPQCAVVERMASVPMDVAQWVDFVFKTAPSVLNSSVNRADHRRLRSIAL